MKIFSYCKMLLVIFFFATNCFAEATLSEDSMIEGDCPRFMSRVGYALGAGGSIISYFFTLPMDTLLLFDDDPNIYVLTEQNTEWLKEKWENATRRCAGKISKLE